MRDNTDATLTRRLAARKYTHNESAFDAVNPESAYWAGFLMADGCVRAGRGVVSLYLAAADRHHVEAFRAFLGSSHPIEVDDRERPVTIMGRRCTKRGFARLSVASPRLAAALARYGVVPRKSLTAAAAGGLEGDRDFWRGVIDGDGSLGFSGRDGKPRLSLVGSATLVGQFADYVARTVGRRPKVSPRLKSAGTAISGLRAAAMIRHLYVGASAALARKARTAGRVAEWEASFVPKQGDWSALTADHLRELLRLHRNWSAVGAAIGANRKTLREVRRRLGLPVHTTAAGAKGEPESNWRQPRFAACQAPGCDRRPHRDGLCSAHSKRLLRYGRLGRARADWSNLTADELAGRYRECGGSWRAVARSLGMGDGSLSKVRRRLGL